MNADAATPPMLTALAPKKSVPVSVSVQPAPALVGVKVRRIGGGNIVKPAIVAAPPEVVTDTAPDTAPALTTAVICVAEFTMNEVAATPPKLTASAVERFVPVITTAVPTIAVVGVKPVIVGAGGV